MFYITTPIYYINSTPTIGSAYTTILADIVSRFKRMKEDVFFLTGLDENSKKTIRAAEKAGMPIRDYIDFMAIKWKNAWKILKIDYDGFIRTTEERHKKVVQEFFNKIYKNGDIYEGEYEGYYCDECEAFLSEKDLVDGKCPYHHKKPAYIKEKNYFFRLSKYQDRLLDYIEKHPDFIQPVKRRNEVVSFIKQGLKDVSISRPSSGWGIEVPFDKNQTIWVWFDALINYISGSPYWPASVHVIGKDIVKFHCVIWPAMLMSAGYELPKRIFVHGFLTVNGVKISKSLGNAIDPIELVKKYSVDGLRYYLAREIPDGEDGDFSEQRLKERINNELVANFSNLFYRVTSFIEKNFNGKVPEPTEEGEKEKKLKELIEETLNNVEKEMDELRINRAIKKVMELSSEVNKYFQENEPWKDPTNSRTTLYYSVNALKVISQLLYPFVPIIGERALKALNSKVCKIENLKKFSIKPGTEIRAEMLMKKIK